MTRQSTIKPNHAAQTSSNTQYTPQSIANQLAIPQPPTTIEPGGLCLREVQKNYKGVR